MLAAMPARAAVPPFIPLAFRVRRNGSIIGSHTVNFVEAGARLTVNTTLNISVRFAGLVLYHYALHATEDWRDGVLQAVRAETDDDGSKLFLRATRQDGRLAVEGSAARYLAPVGAIPASHWNQAELLAPMINLQDGELLDFTVTRRGSAHAGGSGPRHFGADPPGAQLLKGHDTKNWPRRPVTCGQGTLSVRRTDQRPRPQGTRAVQTTVANTQAMLPHAIVHLACAGGCGRGLRPHGSHACRRIAFLWHAAVAMRAIRRGRTGSGFFALYRRTCSLLSAMHLQPYYQHTMRSGRIAGREMGELWNKHQPNRTC